MAARFFAQLGARIISADKVASEVLSPGSPALKALTAEFGRSILTMDGCLNREAMLEILLQDPGNMDRQLSVLAPHILPAVDSHVASWMGVFPGERIMVEAPLLFEYGKRQRYGPVIVVYAPFELQVERLKLRLGIPGERAARIAALQLSIEEKIKRADYVIDNSGSEEDTRDQAVLIYRMLSV